MAGKLKTNRHDKAVPLVAEDRLTDAEIARQCGIAWRTLMGWKAQPEFREAVAAYKERARAAVMDQGIAVQVERIRAKQDRWDRLRQVIEARAQDPDLAGVPGGDTGLLVHQVKGIGRGADFQVVHEYGVDTGLLAEMDRLEMDVAKELGQITDKTEHSGRVRVEAPGLSGLTVEELETIDRIYAEAESRIAGAGAL